jgi:hypothetical protein
LATIGLLLFNIQPGRIAVMKISGYSNQQADQDHIVPEKLAEITLSATPAELRRIGEFLVYCAAEMERMGDVYDHIHLGDRMKEFDTSSPHFVVTRAKAA